MDIDYTSPIDTRYAQQVAREEMGDDTLSLECLSDADRAELCEEALIEASAEELITSLEDLGMSEYVSKLIRANMNRTNKACTA